MVYIQCAPKVWNKFTTYWSRTNPHWIIEAHTQHPQKLNVWTGIVANRIIGHFFFEETHRRKISGVLAK
ncbi:hypothetical protein NQ318_019052 [Aromia moschata]|uniref:Ribosomal protein S19 n=1 Tax=Aromia moschata TaxID=1265417 RepID=A0AAV8Y0Y5_9CUCU|nr:hypothetical protein NQ318_019052 [Aromia moschata]